MILNDKHIEAIRLELSNLTESFEGDVQVSFDDIEITCNVTYRNECRMVCNFNYNHEPEYEQYQVLIINSIIITFEDAREVSCSNIAWCREQLNFEYND